MRTAFTGLEFTIKDQKPDFIIWTGDNLDHYIWWQQNEEHFFNMRIMMNYIFKELNYTGPVFPSLGNHEGYPCDEMNTD